ncbi:MAG: 1,4-alpha-glucan branching enzyme [Lachnospiraceae bacterium]|nr:1,4-alpha-glucan branching enzyme [Lachnospiraceae bacterium]
MDEVLYDLCDWGAIEGIVYADYRDVHGILGPHITEEGILVNAYYPNAKSVTVKLNATGREYDMELVDELGFFSVILPGKKILKYTFVVLDKEGNITKEVDKYAVPSNFSQEDLTRFEHGIHYEVYNKMGAHYTKVGKVEGTYFAVWAPNAFRVSVVGSWNNWDGRIDQMGEIGDTGIFEIFIPGVKPGDLYKYELKIKGGIVQKADPYGYKSEVMPSDASVVWDVENFSWTDDAWIEARKNAGKAYVAVDVENERLSNNQKLKSKKGVDSKKSNGTARANESLEYTEERYNNVKVRDRQAVSVYELHLGSFDKDIVDVNYRDIAPRIADYVSDMGYTHIELMPIMEYKDESLDGYKVTGYYAPTSRYGTPDDFMYFINYMHDKGIGVIVDWVPAYFAADEVGLAYFDGSCLYEHLDPRQGIHPQLGTHLFNYARPQVTNFLIANAFFWFDVYHLDGLRVNDGAAMLYLDFGREPGNWIPNMYGENENLDAVEFFKHLNSIHSKKNDGTMIIAQETTSWMSLTEPVDEDGMGFDYKWNTDWTNDTLEYMHLDPIYRKGKHDQITLSMLYNYSNKYMLQLSHDVVNRYEGSIMTSFKDEFTQNHATMKMVLAYMMTHPGKKLTFMGQDFGYTKKWNTNTPIDWNLLKKENYKQINDLMRDLNVLYKEQKALHLYDFDTKGFQWINEMDAERSIISFIRNGEEQGETLIVVCNFTPVAYENYEIGVPYKGRYKEIFSTEDEKYGGMGLANPRLKNARPGSVDGREYYITITVEPLSVSVYNFTPLVSSKKANEKANEKEANDNNLLGENGSLSKGKKAADKNGTLLKEGDTEKKVNVIAKKAGEVGKTITTKANDASKTITSKATGATKIISAKASDVQKAVTSKASEVLKKAEEAKDYVAETVTVAADDVKKASKKSNVKKTSVKNSKK